MKNQNLLEIKDYDNKETGSFINKNKPLKLKNLGIELPSEPPTKVVSLRLPTELLNKVKAFASQNDISYTSMIKIILARGMDKKYLLHVAESKVNYHKNRAKMPFEEKVKIIIKLQNIENEFIKNNKHRNSKMKYRKVWEIND